MYERKALAGAGTGKVTVFAPLGSVNAGNCCVGLMMVNGLAGLMLTLSQCQVFGGQFASPVALWTIMN
jgi:hypothetical protein